MIYIILAGVLTNRRICPVFPYCIYSLLIYLLCAYAVPIYSRLSPNLLAFTILDITLRESSELLYFTSQFLYLHFFFFFFTALHSTYRGFPGGSVVKNLPARRRCGFDPWVRKIPWRRQWQPTPVFLPGKPPHRGAWQVTVCGVTKVSDMPQ